MARVPVQADHQKPREIWREAAEQDLERDLTLVPRNAGFLVCFGLSSIASYTPLADESVKDGLRGPNFC